ncbi:hypothetical protein B0T25DRAFT_87092 [Lasiosphaeria hispida]|uniref:Uncharacterized protein n=1 Tax=Lasiosphaeria hispida TaxID=260671 RepID=A0AAJ0HPR9_9PEZI|nr:hypothetical protein B0T25DRAFT_87092 [Lasiosphaeria hispida]
MQPARPRPKNMGCSRPDSSAIFSSPKPHCVPRGSGDDDLSPRLRLVCVCVYVCVCVCVRARERERMYVHVPRNTTLGRGCVGWLEAGCVSRGDMFFLLPNVHNPWPNRRFRFSQIPPSTIPPSRQKDNRPLITQRVDWPAGPFLTQPPEPPRPTNKTVPYRS